MPTDGSLAPQAVLDDNQGTDCTPVYSPDGAYLAWLRMRTPGYEADTNRIILFHRSSQQRVSLTDEWDRSPESLLFSPDSKYIYATAQEYGHHKLFAVKVSNGHASELVGSGSSKDVSFIARETRQEGKRNVDALVFLKSTQMMPPEVFTLDLTDDKQQEPLQRTRINYDALLQTLMSTPEVKWFFH